MIITNRNIWNSIAIAIAFDSLGNNFESTTTIILKCSNKTIDKIQQILASAKAKFVNKQSTYITGDLAMILGESQNDIKKESINKIKYFNCHKMKYFKRHYTTTDIWLLKKKHNKIINQQHQ